MTPVLAAPSPLYELEVPGAVDEFVGPAESRC